MRSSLSFDSLNTQQVRSLAVAHRRATSPTDNITDGDLPRIGVEGPYGWKLVTDKLDAHQLVAFLTEAAPTLEHADFAASVGVSLAA